MAPVRQRCLLVAVTVTAKAHGCVWISLVLTAQFLSHHGGARSKVQSSYEPQGWWASRAPQHTRQPDSAVVCWQQGASVRVSNQVECACLCRLRSERQLSDHARTLWRIRTIEGGDWLASRGVTQAAWLSSLDVSPNSAVQRSLSLLCIFQRTKKRLAGLFAPCWPQYAMGTGVTGGVLCKRRFPGAGSH